MNLIGFMQFKTFFAMISKSEIGSEVSKFQKTNRTGSGFCGMPRTLPAFYLLQIWLVCSVQLPLVSIYTHEFLLKSKLAPIP